MNKLVKATLWTVGAAAGAQLVLRAWRQRSPHPMSVSMASWLTSSLRQAVLDLPVITAALDLHPGHQILEVGAGPGLFTVLLAQGVGASGYVCAVDIQSEMLELARERLQGEGLTNVGLRQGDAQALPLPDGAYDRVLLAAVLGEIPDRAKALSEAFRVLRPHGRLVVVDDRLDPDYLNAARVVDEGLAAGFHLRERSATPGRYVLVFERPATPAPLHVPHEQHRIETYG